jgi:uncharacterized protein (DUF433 family)
MVTYQGEQMSEIHRITVDPSRCGGRPCLRGLRIRVCDVLDLLAAGRWPLALTVRKSWQTIRC